MAEIIWDSSFSLSDGNRGKFMSNTLNATTTLDEGMVYTIRLKGHLGRQWAEWFDGLTITLEENGETVLAGRVMDQAALHGLLKKVRDLGMTLISVNRAGCDENEE
jgi:hypothetical protein